MLSTVLRVLTIAVACGAVVSHASDAGREQRSDATNVASDLESWISWQREQSFARLLRNAAPGVAPFTRRVETKWVSPERMALLRAAEARGAVRIEGNEFEQIIIPRPGAVVAAPAASPPEPDYFFHWVRDSAVVMRELADLDAARAAPLPEDLQRRLADFAAFSRQLQSSDSPEGLGEVRYNADGTQDFLKWSRPQLDGPALRVLALLPLVANARSPAASAAAAEAIRSDLDYLAANWTRPSFDLWEDFCWHNYYTLAVQAGAFERGAEWASERGEAARATEYSTQRTRILAAMDAYWSEEKGYLEFAHGPAERCTPWGAGAGEKPGDNLESAVLLGALHSRRSSGPHALIDERVLATAVAIEDLFTSLYAFNRALSAEEGKLIGRNRGDQYYGGNPWVFITLGFAEFHYRLAGVLGDAGSFRVTTANREFVRRALARVGEPSSEPGLGVLAPAQMATLLRGLLLRGDDVLRTVRRLTAENSGALSEQFDLAGGTTSSRDLSWSHAAFLSATDARREAMTGRDCE